MADAGFDIICFLSVFGLFAFACIAIAIGSKYGRAGRKIAIIATAIAVIFVGSAVLYLATRHSADLGLQFVEAERNNYTKIQWGENIYIRAETRPLGRQSFTVGKFISLVDGNRGFKVFEIPGISVEEWIRVQFWGDSWSMYRREGATGDFPGSS
jgi:hypothetical protein